MEWVYTSVNTGFGKEISNNPESFFLSLCSGNLFPLWTERCERSSFRFFTDFVSDELFALFKFQPVFYWSFQACEEAGEDILEGEIALARAMETIPAVAISIRELLTMTMPRYASSAEGAMPIAAEY